MPGNPRRWLRQRTRARMPPQSIGLRRYLICKALRFAPCRGSSVVERSPEEAGVDSSILSPGTIRLRPALWRNYAEIIAGVVHRQNASLPRKRQRVQFPSPAPFGFALRFAGLRRN